jgi:hypothetical protein
MKGFSFAERLYYSEYIPTNIVKIYLLLLKLIWMNGVADINYVWRRGYNNKIINRAVSEGYIEIVEKPIQISKHIHSKIEKIVGEAPEEIYA